MSQTDHTALLFLGGNMSAKKKKQYHPNKTPISQFTDVLLEAILTDLKIKSNGKKFRKYDISEDCIRAGIKLLYPEIFERTSKLYPELLKT